MAWHRILPFRTGLRRGVSRMDNRVFFLEKKLLNFRKVEDSLGATSGFYFVNFLVKETMQFTSPP